MSLTQAPAGALELQLPRRPGGESERERCHLHHDRPEHRRIRLTLRRRRVLGDLFAGSYPPWDNPSRFERPWPSP